MATGYHVSSHVREKMIHNEDSSGKCKKLTIWFNLLTQEHLNSQDGDRLRAQDLGKVNQADIRSGHRLRWSALKQSGFQNQIYFLSPSKLTTARMLSWRLETGCRRWPEVDNVGTNKNGVGG
ncbi:conserved hypothetical protein [Ricinus communis]|uniref:Uncharacterized protein n=1 Tax=Ricinus communis TaxID=3988 RepID=B9SIS8_RICCO|nr:conserved hypothetical protein [Ricinus communis]